MTEKKFRLYGPAILSIFLLIFFYAMLIELSAASLRWALIPVFYSVLSWESGRLLAICCRRRMPGIHNAKKRIFFIFITGLPVAALVGFADQLFTLWLGLYQHLSFADYFFITGLNILCCSIAVGVYESNYYLQQWKSLFLESETLKKQNSIGQFQFLREQIKPHFLFNSLNTLSALISTNPLKAELYVEEMSTVYRYLLTKHEKELTTLKEELSFLDSYLAMLRIRFENALNIHLKFDEKLQDHLLPPFVLQLLIENAVKHNIISKDSPLNISIYTDDQKNLHVENNLQLKPRPETSEQKGLANIILRYSLLNRRNGLHITKSNGFFKVTLPLIKTNIYATPHLLTD